LILNNY